MDVHKISVSFRGVVEVHTPDGMTEERAKELAEIKAMSYVFASLDNPDPCEGAYEEFEYGFENSAGEEEIANYWDETELIGVCGEWKTE